MQVSVQRPERTIFFRPVFWMAATKFGSSHEFMLERSISGCPREHGLDLRPHVTAEALGLDGGEDDGHVEEAGGLREDEVVVDDGLAVEVRDAEEHLRLEVDEGDDAVVGGEQALLAQLGSAIAGGHHILPFMVAAVFTRSRTPDSTC